MNYLLLGKIVKPHGLKGEVKIFSSTDFAKLRYQKDHVVFVYLNNEYKPLTVDHYFRLSNYDVVAFKEYNDINKINELLNKDIFIKKEDATLPKNYFHYIDLIKSIIIDENNNEIGIVKAIVDYPANKCLKCIHNKTHKEFEIPFVDEFILNIDITKKIIKVKLIEGML